MFGYIKYFSYLCNTEMNKELRIKTMKHAKNTAIHRNASDGASECLRRPPPMLRDRRRNASLPPIGDIRTTLARRSEGKSE